MAAAVADLRESLARLGRRLWRGLRSWSGDAAYDRYLEARARQGCRGPAISRERFYLEQLEKRYSKASRCC
jgi:uncharacterized short protein YbdD (DUF466 family)